MHTELIEREPTRWAMRLPAVQKVVPLSTSAIYAKMAAGTFPKPFRLGKGARAVAWWSDEIQKWLAQQAAERGIA